jgi:hypothetical protein
MLKQERGGQPFRLKSGEMCIYSTPHFDAKREPQPTIWDDYPGKAEFKGFGQIL